MRVHIGDVVLVTKIAERDIEYRHEKDSLGYLRRGVFRVLRTYPTDPLLAMVVGMRDVHTGEIVDDHGFHALSTYCKHRLYLVRTGPMNREVLVPPDGLELVNDLNRAVFHAALRNGRLRGPTFTKVGEGATLKCSDEAMMIALLARRS